MSKTHRSGSVLLKPRQLKRMRQWEALHSQIGVKGKTLQVAEISLGQGARQNRMLLEGSNVHEGWFDTRADLFTKLGKNVKAAVVHV